MLMLMMCILGCEYCYKSLCADNWQTGKHALSLACALPGKAKEDCSSCPLPGNGSIRQPWVRPVLCFVFSLFEWRISFSPLFLPSIYLVLCHTVAGSKSLRWIRSFWAQACVRTGSTCLAKGSSKLHMLFSHFHVDTHKTENLQRPPVRLAETSSTRSQRVKSSSQRPGEQRHMPLYVTMR